MMFIMFLSIELVKKDEKCRSFSKLMMLDFEPHAPRLVSENRLEFRFVDIVRLFQRMIFSFHLLSQSGNRQVHHALH